MHDCNPIRAVSIGTRCAALNASTVRAASCSWLVVGAGDAPVTCARSTSPARSTRLVESGTAAVTDGEATQLMSQRVGTVTGVLEAEEQTLDERAAALVGQRIRLPDEAAIVLVDMCVPRAGKLDLYVADPSKSDGNDDGGASLRKVSLTAEEFESLQVVAADGRAAPEAVLAGLWTEWMLDAARAAASTVLVSTRLRPYPHQMDAVYGRMLTQPLLRFLLADEPGTGKTMMSGLWLREAQRLGLVKRALVVCPAHLVGKWQADFERFLGGGLREVTAETAWPLPKTTLGWCRCIWPPRTRRYARRCIRTRPAGMLSSSTRRTA